VGGGEPRQKKRVPARKVAWKPAAKDAKKTAAKKAPPKKARATSASGSRHGAGKSELRRLSMAELYERATEQDIPGGRR
jgi:DNA end-binding protein Ku